MEVKMAVPSMLFRSNFQGILGQNILINKPMFSPPLATQFYQTCSSITIQLHVTFGASLVPLLIRRVTPVMHRVTGRVRSHL